MNPRIKELAEQSGLKVESWMTNPPKPFQILGSTEQFESFAMLIVRECLDKVAEAAHARRDPFFAYSQIQEHFGVEQ